MLTPSGAMEKTRLTYEYIATSYQYFKSATQKVKNLYLALQNEGKTRIVFYGAGELANIALHTMAGTDLQLVAVVDPKRKGEKFSECVVGDISLLKQCNYHAILITTVDHHEAILEEIDQFGVASNKVYFF